jgi:hypothetical protein
LAVGIPEQTGARKVFVAGRRGPAHRNELRWIILIDMDFTDRNDALKACHKKVI